MTFHRANINEKDNILIDYYEMSSLVMSKVAAQVQKPTLIIFVCLPKLDLRQEISLRTFARIFSNIDFCLKFLPSKDDELVMSEM